MTVKFQLDSCSNLSIINVHTWRRLNKPSLLRTKKTARSVTVDWIKILAEVALRITSNGITEKLKAYVQKNTDNLFVTDCIENFNLSDCSMSTYCRKLESPTTNIEKLKQEQKFPGVFFGGLRKCTKIKAHFQIKENALPILLNERNVPFAALVQISDELDRLERAAIMSV